MNEELKARLLRPHLAEDDVHIEGVGTVRVRALTRAEVLMLQRHDQVSRERKMVALAMVDPAMSEAEVGEWTKASPSGELEAVTVRIAELSGLVVEKDREVYREFEEEPETEFRVLPGAEAGDDRGTAPGGDE